MSEIDEQLRGNLQQFQEALERIENLQQEVPNMGLKVAVDEETKRQLRRELYDLHLKEYNRLAELKKAEVAQDMAAARQSLFRTTPNITETHTEISLSTRDAQDRVRGITSPSELSARLRDAVELNDRVMSRQILRQAVDTLGDIGEAGGSLVREYLSYYPSDEQAYYNLEDASQAQERLQMFGVPFSPSNPEDISVSFSKGAASGGVIPEGIVGSVETSDGGE